jgi:hypothetical protein
MGRPRKPDAMTGAERTRLYRDKKRQGRALAALQRAWDECSKAERTRFLRALGADRL